MLAASLFVLAGCDPLGVTPDDLAGGNTGGTTGTYPSPQGTGGMPYVDPNPNGGMPAPWQLETGGAAPTEPPYASGAGGSAYFPEETGGTAGTAGQAGAGAAGAPTELPATAGAAGAITTGTEHAGEGPVTTVAGAR